MTREEAIGLVKSAFDAWEYQYDTGDDWSREHEARDMAIKALNQEPCDDAISRQAAIDAVSIDNLHPGIVGALQSILAELPPVTPQPKMGRWVYTGDYITEGMLKCSECGFEHDVSERFSYCPNCGIKMQEVKE